MKPLARIDDLHIKIIAGMVGTSAALMFKKGLAQVLPVTAEDVLLRLDRCKRRLQDLALQDLVLLNEQIVFWLNAGRCPAGQEDLARANLLAYMKHLQRARQREAVAPLASMLENLKFEKAITFTAASLPTPVGVYVDPWLSGRENTAGWEPDELHNDQINDRIRTAQETGSWGSIPGRWKERILAALWPKLNYRAVLRQFRASVLSVRRRLTRMKPNRRYGFQYMGSRYDFTTRLLFAVDVSGSIFAPVMRFLDEHRDYDGAIIFTDGYAPVPPRPKNRRTRVRPTRSVHAQHDHRPASGTRGHCGDAFGDRRTRGTILGTCYPDFIEL